MGEACVRFTGILMLLSLFAAAAEAQPVVTRDEFDRSVVVRADKTEMPIAADLDGDGKPDRIYAVRVQRRNAADPADATLRIANPFARRPLAPGGEPLALAIAHASGARWIIHDREFFTTPIWGKAKLPLGIARRGSAEHRSLVQQGAKPRGDMLLLGTEAGIDIALYWTGNGYAVFAPKEEP